MFSVHVAEWITGFATYYNVERDSAKKIFKRLHTGGSMYVDEGAGSGVRYDVLPCVLELKHVLAKAHKFLSESDEIYKDIYNLPSVQARANPSVSAFAIYMQHLMADTLELVRPLVEAAGLRIVAYVFDSIYVLGESELHLKDSFAMVAVEAYEAHEVRLSWKSASGEKI